MLVSQTSIIHALIGGILIGLAASLLLLANGRIFGISGILASAVLPTESADSDGRAWRIAVIAGLLIAGILLSYLIPSTMMVITTHPLAWYAVAGLLVGYGTQLGGGCTSGHGICGISRFSPRSILATVIFILAGMITVALIRHVG